jgi:hypothetical protein
MWVGVLIICSSFFVTDCTPLVSHKTFITVDECAKELAEVQLQAKKNGLVTIGACRKVNTLERSA